MKNKAQMKTKKLKISSLHRPKNCKGQMKIQQTAFMLLAVTLFFILIGLFVLVFRVSSLTDTATMLEQENAMLLVSKLAESPEFSCEFAFENTRTACVDADKVMMLKKNINEYQDFWGVSSIEILKIYPKSEGECDVLNYPNCGEIKVYSDGKTAYTKSNFVSLCRKEATGEESYNKCELAKIIVGYETKS